MKTYWEGRCIAPHILDLGTTRWRWVVIFTSRPLYPGERAPDTHWIGGRVGPRAGLDAVTRKIPCPCRESNLGRPARSLVADYAFLCGGSQLFYSKYIAIRRSHLERKCLISTHDKAMLNNWCIRNKYGGLVTVTCWLTARSSLNTLNDRQWTCKMRTIITKQQKPS